MNTIFGFFDKFWIIKLYDNIYLRKELFFEIMGFVKMNPPYIHLMNTIRKSPVSNA